MVNDTCVNCSIRSNQLLIEAMNSTAPLTSPLIEGNAELIISFTTYNKRIHDVHLVVESIAQQTVKPNRLILWLDEGEFTLESLPLILHKQMERGLEVRFCPNYRSYKKLIPTLKEFPEANVITIDDDVLYPYDTIELLYREHLQEPTSIIAHRVRNMNFDERGELLDYKTWDYEIVQNKASFQLLAIGLGGVLYPAHSLHEKCLDVECFTRLAPFADDVWFKAMALLNKTKCKKVKDERDFLKRFHLIQETQDIALYNNNIGDNDLQIKAVFNQFELYPKLLD
ncbi:glycosyl transferase [Psychromonas sp. psych-6C06]|uniref:glycosyl transferase n=1 Tax=Psychromonas sp. psych-6C06 TaxID=2058089 RepID=UPI000C33765B|nr:glycosyl transferase [Psychromonas sp. psych-6C06]PKF61857.1 glycosyl transferase [Psychromonas sp. psych-6C06]